MDALFKIVPESLRNAVLREAQNLESSTSVAFFREYQIPFEETQQAFESAKIIVEGVTLSLAGGAVGKVATAAYKQAKHLGQGVINQSKAAPQLKTLFKNINDIKTGSAGVERVPLEGAVLSMEYKFTKGGTLNIFVNSLTAIMKDGTLAEIGKSTPTSGAVIQTFRRIVNSAEQLKAKEVFIQWIPSNLRLLELAEKYKWMRFVDDRPCITNPPKKTIKDLAERIPEICTFPTFTIPRELLTAGNLSKAMGPRLGAATSLIAGFMPDNFEAAFYRKLEKFLDSYVPGERIWNHPVMQSQQKGIAPSTRDDEQKAPIVEVAKKTSLIGQIAELDSSKNVPGTTLLKKIDEVLPSQLEVTVENLTHLRKMTINVMHPVGDDGLKAGVGFCPKNPKNTTVVLSKNVDDNTSLRVGIAPLNPKSSTVALSSTVEGVSGSITVNPFRPKDSQVAVGAQLDKANMGYAFSIQKPLQGKVSVSVPVRIAGVPASVGALISLRKPLESRVRLSIPLPGMTVPVVSISVQSGVKVYKSVERRIKRAFGKKKRHKCVESVPVDTSAATATAHFMKGHAFYHQKNFTAAWEEFSKAYSLKPNDFWHAYYVGATALNLHERKIALEFIDKAEALNPGRFDDHVTLANSYFGLDQFDKAATHSSRAIQINSGNAQTSSTILANSQKLHALYQTLDASPPNSYDARIATATAILAIKADHVNALFLRAHAYYHKKNLEQAWQDLTKAYELNPHDFWIAYYVAATALEFGERTTALEFAGRSETLNPGRWSDYETLAGIYFKMDQFDKAVANANKAIGLNSAAAVGSKSVLANCQKLQPLVKNLESFKTEQFDEKIATANAILAIKADHVNALYLRAHAHYYKENLMQAWQDITKAYQLNPNSYWITYYVASTALKLDERTMAIEFFDRASTLNPGTCAEFERLAETYFKLDQFDKAIVNAKKAIELNSAAAVRSKTLLANSQKLQPLVTKLQGFKNEQFNEKIVTTNEILAIKPTHSGALFLRAHAHYCLGHYDQAWPDIKKAYEVNPKDYRITYYVGLTAQKLNDPETATAFFLKASELAPKKHEPHESLAGLYLKQNDLPRALQSVQRSLALNPQNGSSLDLLERIRGCKV